MRKQVLATLIAAVSIPLAAAPGTAAAQSRHHGRHDHDRGHDRDHHRSHRDHDRWGEHDRRGDHDRHWGRDDWRSHRDHNRDIYRRGHWRAPFRYHHFRSGTRIGRTYYSSRYYISDPWRYRLPRAGHWQRWVRHYDDVLLVDVRRGIVLRVIPNFFW